MQSDRSLSPPILQRLDIWLDNGNVDGFKVTTALARILRQGDFDTFEEIAKTLESAPFGKKVAQRLINARNQFNGMRHAMGQAERDATLERIELTPLPTEKVELESINDIFQREPGLYYRNRPAGTYNTFTHDFASYSDDVRGLLKERGFDKPVAKHSQQKFRVLNNARLHTFNHNFFAVSDGDGNYDAQNGARLAKLSNVNYLRRGPTRRIDRAIILPFDHACNNYYHNLSEALSGLRFVPELPEGVPVIYTEDRFSALDFMASRLCMDRGRLLSMKECENLLVEKAVLLFPHNYTWDNDIYAFHKRISYPQTRNSRIYISRRKASRGPTNELEVERELEKLGFEILFPENLDFARQVEVFSNASVLVAPHGAGLTNMLFMPKGGTLIEVFNAGFVMPDFYLRSRPNNARYGLVIQSGDELDLEALKKEISRLT